jgi:hypothetical protein
MPKLRDWFEIDERKDDQKEIEESFEREFGE